MNLHADILPAIGTGKNSAPVWHHNLSGLMLAASCSLDVSEMVLTEHRNPNETDEGTSPGSL